MDETIAGWSPADLRRFVVNTILTDPGAYPKQAKDNTPTLPTQPGLVNGNVPVWNSTKNTWEAQHGVTVPNDVSYIRVQGGLSGFIADTNFRIYNLSSPSVILEQDTQNRVALSGGTLAINTPGVYQIGVYVIGRAALYEAGWTMTYNGATIDSSAGNGVNYGGLGSVQPLSVSAMTITNYFSSPGYVQVSGFQNDATINGAGLWANWMPQ